MMPGPPAYDLFIIAGQSNATDIYHQLSLAVTPDAGTALLWDTASGTWKDMEATRGFWSAFARDYYDRTGRIPMIVPVAISATSAYSWKRGESSYVVAVATADAALAAAAPNGVRSAAGFIWLQGESDHALTQAAYKAELLQVLIDWRLRYGAELKAFIHLVGDHSVGRPCAQIRAAQLEVIAGDALNHLASATIQSFRTRGLLLDGVHYTQAGYNEVGFMTAKAAATARMLDPSSMRSHTTTRPSWQAPGK